MKFFNSKMRAAALVFFLAATSSHAFANDGGGFPGAVGNMKLYLTVAPSGTDGVYNVMISATNIEGTTTYSNPTPQAVSGSTTGALMTTDANGKPVQVEVVNNDVTYVATVEGGTLEDLVQSEDNVKITFTKKDKNKATTDRPVKTEGVPKKN